MGNGKVDFWLPALFGGRFFLLDIDPDGVLSGCVVSKIVHGIGKGGERVGVMAILITENGKQFGISGYVDKGKLFVDGVQRSGTGAESEKVKFSPVSTVKKAFEENPSLSDYLSDLLVLSDNGKNVIKSPGYSYPVFQAEEDCVFRFMDGGKPDSGYRIRFNSCRIVYGYTEQGFPASAGISFASLVEDGRILARAVVDSNGITDIKVILDKDLGLGRKTSCDCFVEVAGKRTASLPVAFDLASAIGSMYAKQRRSKISIGKPRAQKKS